MFYTGEATLAWSLFIAAHAPYVFGAAIVIVVRLPNQMPRWRWRRQWLGSLTENLGYSRLISCVRLTRLPRTAAVLQKLSPCRSVRWRLSWHAIERPGLHTFIEQLRFKLVLVRLLPIFPLLKCVEKHEESTLPAPCMEVSTLSIAQFIE